MSAYWSRAKVIWRKVKRAARICGLTAEINLGSAMAVLGFAVLWVWMEDGFRTVYTGPLMGLGLLAAGGIVTVSGVKELLALGSGR
jgi:hypothetical protein